jgi:polyhydroxybutyrate depolymerase
MCIVILLTCLGCAKGDVVLGERGAIPPAQAPAASSETEPPSRAAVGVAEPTLPSGVAAGSGNPSALPSVDAAVTPGDASVPVRDSDADSGAPNPVGRPSAGCGRAPGATSSSVEVSGTPVEFLLDTPTGYDPARAYALVLAFRGTDQSAADFRAQLQLATVMGADAIIVHANPVDGTSWEFQRDIPLVDALVSTLGAAYCIDRDRVFAIGDSAGALFVNLVGCVRADKVRGIAMLSSAPPPPGPCLDNTAVWLLQQTDNDPMTVGAGLGNRDFWAVRNSCNVWMPMSITPASCVQYAGCRESLPVHFCEHNGDDLPSFAISTAWEFFRSL